MVDTQPLAPTDAEIAALYAEQTGFILGDSPAALLDFARAVLAKWGVQKPAAPIPDLGFIIEKRAGVDVLAWDKGGCRPATSTEIAMWHSLAAAPQPVVREPLTPVQIEEHCGQIDLGDPDWVTQVVRAAEAAHGIKGGEHDEQ